MTIKWSNQILRSAISLHSFIVYTKWIPERDRVNCVYQIGVWCRQWSLVSPMVEKSKMTTNPWEKMIFWWSNWIDFLININHMDSLKISVKWNGLYGVFYELIYLYQLFQNDWIWWLKLKIWNDEISMKEASNRKSNGSLLV